ncbi:hypothetical protein F5Y15DRAFT_239596 [Xylariaceae sp. FL0016]|nr:hypothetical protein F5Y15DRAFT_239596 [Xylariaceae sp. FL0016]
MRGLIVPSALVLLLLTGAATSLQTCYDTNGYVKDTYLPCHPDADISVCCSTSDYCLDNNLCLDSGGDNMYSVQGCTDKDWGAPCQQYCPDLPPTFNWYQDLTLCETIDRTSGLYCCGENATCCAAATASYITIPIFSSVFRAAATATAAPADATTSVLTTTVSPSSPSSSDASAGSSGSGSSNDGSSRALAIGLGVGVPVALIMGAAMAFLGWQIRRNGLREEQRQKNESASSGDGLSYVTYSTQPAPPTELNGESLKVELPVRGIELR